MKIGQRAYLSLEGGGMKINQWAEDAVETLYPKHTGTALEIVFDFKLHNHGNTPARIGNASMKCETSKSYPAERCQTEFSLPSVVDGKQAQQAGGRHVFLLRDDGVFGFDKDWKAGIGLRIEGAVQYFDVFGDHHDVTWCWYFEDTYTHPSNCKTEK